MLAENFPIQVMLTNEPFDNSKTYIYDLEEGMRNKPRKALWTSSLHLDRDGFLSDWEMWCDAESFGVWTHAVVFIPKTKLNILDITGSDDDPWYVELLDQFPEFVRKNRYRDDTVLDIKLDFCELRNAGYDGVRIEDARSDILGNWFCCWDCESTVWLNSNFYTMYRGGTIDEIHKWANRQRTVLAKIQREGSKARNRG